jgi:hypothetical protein
MKRRLITLIGGSTLVIGLRTLENANRVRPFPGDEPWETLE